MLSITILLQVYSELVQNEKIRERERERENVKGSNCCAYRLYCWFFALVGGGGGGGHCQCMVLDTAG